MSPPPRVTQKQMSQALMIPISVHELKFFAYPERYGRAIFDTGDYSPPVKVG